MNPGQSLLLRHQTGAPLMTPRQRPGPSQTAQRIVCVATRDIKLIATDVDGTLLNSKQELAPRVQQAVSAAVACGIPVVVATGKPRGPWAKKILPLLGPPVPGVFMQGLVLTDGEGKTLYCRDLDPDIGRDGIECARELGLTFAAYCTDRVLSEVINEHTDILIFYGEPEPEKTEDLAEVISSGRIPLQKFILLEKQERMEEVRPLIEQRFGDRAHITTALPGMLEVLPQGASKGDGLRRLLDIMGVAPQNVMAMGDGENDIEMFSLVGFSVAMGNAVPKTLAAADEVVASHNEDGVAEAIEQYVLEPLGATATAS